MSNSATLRITTNFGCGHANALGSMPLFSASENEHTDAEGFSVVTYKKGLKRKLQKHKSYSNSSSDEFSNSKKRQLPPSSG